MLGILNLFQFFFNCQQDNSCLIQTFGMFLVLSFKYIYKFSGVHIDQYYQIVFQMIIKQCNVFNIFVSMFHLQNKDEDIACIMELT